VTVNRVPKVLPLMGLDYPTMDVLALMSCQLCSTSEPLCIGVASVLTHSGLRRFFGR
jgi:hypothetical protein